MSKIVELLTYKKKSSDTTEQGDIFSGKIARDNFDFDTNEKIANTYIFNPLAASENRKKESVNNHTLSSHAAPSPTAKSAHFLPWLIAFLAVLLLLVNIVYRGKISVNIEVVNGDKPRDIAAKQESYDIAKYSPLKNEDLGIERPADFLIYDGQIDTKTIKKIGFYGAALNESKLLKDGFSLTNDGTTGWASTGIDLAAPADLTNSSLDFFVKGANGKESLQLILRDAGSNSYTPQASNFIFSKNMEREWQFVSLPFENFKGTCNIKQINHIGFEFGTQTTSNEPGTSVYVRDIKIVRH